MQSCITIKQLLQVFWDVHDPTQADRQGNDVGSQYRSAIFYEDAVIRAVATTSLRGEEERLRDVRGDGSLQIATKLEPLEFFWPAEDFHQRYLAKKGQADAKGTETPIRCYG